MLLGLGILIVYICIFYSASIAQDILLDDCADYLYVFVGVCAFVFNGTCMTT